MKTIAIGTQLLTAKKNLDDNFGDPQDYFPHDDVDEYHDADMDGGEDNMVDSLRLAGAVPHDARAHVKAMLGDRPKATLMEVYGRGAIIDCANHARRNLNLHGLGALDLRTTKEDGTSWDFSCRADRRAARTLLNKNDPDWVIGSPPCTAFSIWNSAMNNPKISKEAAPKAISPGRSHLNFVVFWADGRSAEAGTSCMSTLRLLYRGKKTRSWPS